MAVSYIPVVVLYLVTLVLFILLHLRGTYDPVRTAVSDYAIGPTQTLFLVDGATGGLAAAWLGALLLTDAHFPPVSGAFLLAHACFRVGVLAFPVDLEGHAASRHGRFHYAFAVPGFVMVYLAIHTLGPATRLMFPEAIHITLATLETVASVALAFVAVCLISPLHRLFGLVERVFLLSTALWLGGFSLAMLSLTMSSVA